MENQSNTAQKPNKTVIIVLTPDGRLAVNRENIDVEGAIGILHMAQNVLTTLAINTTQIMNVERDRPKPDGQITQ